MNPLLLKQPGVRLGIKPPPEGNCTEQDKANEVKAVEILLRSFPELTSEFTTGKFDRNDIFLCQGGKRVIILDVKTRTGDAKYDTWLISESKVRELESIARMQGIPQVMLVFQWDNGVWWTAFSAGSIPSDFVVRPGGRDDRGYIKDREPCYYIPVKYFVKAGPTPLSPFPVGMGQDKRSV